METLTEKRKRINGWGTEAATENEPDYAIDNSAGDDHNYQRPEQPAFSTATPLSGLSGFLRRQALRYRESGFGRWLPLIFADRVNIWGGFLHDFRRGVFPKIFGRKVVKAGLKLRRKHLIATTSVSVLATAFVFAWLVTGSRRKKKRAMK